MRLKIYSLIALMLVGISYSCDKKPKEEPTPPPTNKEAAILFGTVVTNPEGNSGSGYLQAIHSFAPAKYDNKNSIQAGFGSVIIAAPSGRIYLFPDYMGNAKAEIKQYALDAEQKLVQKGALPIPGGASACNIVELNDQKAYLCCQKINLIIVFNPTTMKEIKRIDLSQLSHKDSNAAPATMVIRDKYLYIGLSHFNSQWMPTENTVEIALVDTQTDQYVKTIRNETLGVCSPTRPVDSHSMFVDEQGDIYINCMGSWSFIPGFNAGIIRIKKGETEIDPNYCIRLDNTAITGLTAHADFLGSVYYGGNGLLYAYANVKALDPEGADKPYTTINHCAVQVDLYKKTMRVIEGLPISNPQGIAIGTHKDLIVFGSANKKHNGFYTYDPKSGKVAGPVIEVQGWPHFFHSFAR